MNNLEIKNKYISFLKIDMEIAIHNNTSPPLLQVLSSPSHLIVPSHDLYPPLDKDQAESALPSGNNCSATGHSLVVTAVKYYTFSSTERG